MTKAPPDDPPNAGEAAYWSSPAGQKWVDHQESLDRLFGGITEALLREALPQPGEHVLDLGCGTGATTFTFSRHIAPGGTITGLDISPVMLGLARTRAENAGAAGLVFREADAQTFPFAPNSFDLLVSRFGCMFFSDPPRAFRNLRLAVRPGGRVWLATWSAMTENPWMAIPREIAVARLGAPPKAAPNEPGPFAFADRDYAIGILTEAGFLDVEAAPRRLDLVAPDTIEEAGRLASHVGPAARVMSARNGTAEDAAAIAEDVSVALLPYQGPHGLRVPTVINLFSARSP